VQQYVTLVCSDCVTYCNTGASSAPKVSLPHASFHYHASTLAGDCADEPMTSLPTEIATHSRRRDHRTIYSTAIAPFHAVAPSTGRYHVLRQNSLDSTSLLRAIALLSPYPRLITHSFCTRLSETRRIIAVTE